MPITSTVLEAMLIDAYRIRSITGYNRLEASPRTAEFDRSLKAEVRDALWMLTRQWQFGEFQGEDAASAATSQILGEHTVMDRVAFPGNNVFPYSETIPLETQVECERLTGNLFLASQLCRYFVRLMKDAALLGFINQLRTKYPLNYTIDKNDFEGQQLFNAVKDELFDGFLLHTDTVTPGVGGGTAFDDWMNAEAIGGVEQGQFRTIVTKFQNWYTRNYTQPATAASAWLPAQLEYQFAVSSPMVDQQQPTLTADQYYEGHLDWYSFDINKDRLIPVEEEPAPNTKENFVSFIPSPIAFKGMPHPRYWTMEESITDFGNIDTSVTGLLHLMLAEFGLIYSNDWFMLPYPLHINTLCEVKGIVITDVFGEHILVRPAGKGAETNWHRWSMFHHTDTNNTNNLTNLLYLPPAITKAYEGEPLEKVNFLRDEMANMVWAVENRVPSQAGKGVSGMEMAMKSDAPTPFIPVNNTVPIRYVAGTTVPDNWIPFVPVHMEGSDREIRLQRARMPGAKGALGVLLTEKAAPYYVNEEEVPRAGAIVQRSFQRTRWLNGITYLWIGRYKETGKGEGSSHLQFDQIWDIKENAVPPEEE
jgi:hypothetical protein